MSLQRGQEVLTDCEAPADLFDQVIHCLFLHR